MLQHMIHNNVLEDVNIHLLHFGLFYKVLNVFQMLKNFICSLGVKHVLRQETFFHKSIWYGKAQKVCVNMLLANATGASEDKYSS